MVASKVCRYGERHLHHRDVEDFRREIKRQFYPEDVAYLARKNMRRLKHTGSIRDYVKEFSSLMLEIPNMTEEELLFNFMDNLQGWAEQELRRRGVQDLATAMAVAESLTDYRRGDSSKIESLEDSHAMGGGDEVPRDHNAPKKGSGKTSNGVQVKEEKGERAEVARTHMEEVTKGKVNSMGKRKQHSKRQKRTGLHPSEASREKEVKNILAERVTRRQGIPPKIEYLVQWKGLPKRQASWEHADALRSFWKHIERGKLLETPGAIYTKPLVGRVWKVLEMPRDVHTSLHYGGRHGRSPRLSRDF
ncbi:hypothetical protein CK203_008029 [Vitis vinifera]|uniref:Chromo domain-containing protein n=1 Tax=Vitis vinifera TaxID=29760 RepID=A0A438K1L1_VITVI|nr:hypothetical protein CK203_008029 [Vitis vinifera]